MIEFFKTSDDLTMKAPSTDEINRYNLAKADWDKTKAALAAYLTAYLENESLKKQVVWEKTYRPAAPIWAPFAIGKLDASDGVNLEQDEKGVVRASGGVTHAEDVVGDQDAQVVRVQLLRFEGERVGRLGLAQRKRHYEY